MKKLSLILLLMPIIIGGSTGTFRVAQNFNTVKFSFPHSKTGYIWIFEFTGRDPGRLYTFVDTLDHSKNFNYTLQDTNSSIVVYFFENNKRIDFDTSYYFLLNKPGGYGILSYFANLKNEDKKAIKLWEKEHSKNTEYYDYWDNYLQSLLKEEVINKEDIYKMIDSLKVDEKDNPSFIHAAYLTASWLLKDDAKAKEIFSMANNLPENPYKEDILFVHYQKKLDKNSINKIWKLNLDLQNPEFRLDKILFFLSPLSKRKPNELSPLIDSLIKTHKLIKWDIYVFLLYLIRDKDSATAKKYVDVFKEFLNPTSIRKSFAFINYYNIFSRQGNKLDKFIKEGLENDIKTNNMYLSDYYNLIGNYNEAYNYIKKYVKKDIINMDEEILYRYAFLTKKMGRTDNSVDAFYVLSSLYGWDTALDTLKSLLKGRFQEKYRQLEKRFTPQLPLMPPFEATTIIGKKIRPEDLKDKIIVLNFWQTICTPSRREIPILNNIVDDLNKRKDVAFLAITNEKESVVKNFLKTHTFKYEMIANGQNIMDKFNVKHYPSHFIINKEGKIIFKMMGYAPNMKEKFEKIISSL